MKILWLTFLLTPITFLIHRLTQPKRGKSPLGKPRKNTPYQGTIQGDGGITLKYQVTTRPETESEETSKNLLKEATKKKDDGDLTGAIACLREAYNLMSQPEHTTIYPIDTYLRLPVMLQQAGLYTEAIVEFKNLACGSQKQIAREFSHAPKDTQNSLVAMNYAKIFDKMRLVAHREKHLVHAVYYQALSLANQAVGLKLQNRQKELDGFTDRQFWANRILPTLKKAKKDILLEKLTDACMVFARSYTAYSTNLLAKEIESLLEIDPKSIGVTMADLFEGSARIHNRSMANT